MQGGDVMSRTRGQESQVLQACQQCVSTRWACIDPTQECIEWPIVRRDPRKNEQRKGVEDGREGLRRAAMGRLCVGRGDVGGGGKEMKRRRDRKRDKKEVKRRNDCPNKK